MTTARHVIFGTGAIGLATCDALRRRGETVRLVNRSGHAPVPDDVEVIGSDARDAAFTRAAAIPVLWALGWTTTTLGGIHVEEQFTVYGAYGAITFSALSGLLLHYLLPYRAAVGSPLAATPAEATE